MYQLFIADDEHWIIEGIKTSIAWEKEGYQFTGCAENGPDAVEKLISLKPHLALIDIRMPGFDGLEVIRRAKPLCPDTHFIIVSGYAEFDYAIKGIELQVAGYVLKPIEEEKLLLLVRSLRMPQAVAPAKANENANRAKEEPSLRDELISYIGEHMCESLSFHDLCVRFTKSPTAMRTVFLQEIGMPFTQYLTNLRMQHAARLLTTTEDLVNEIAVSCGYEDPLYFRKVFKRHFGVIPSEYRSSH